MKKIFKTLNIALVVSIAACTANTFAVTDLLERTGQTTQAVVKKATIMANQLYTAVKTPALNIVKKNPMIIKGSVLTVLGVVAIAVAYTAYKNSWVTKSLCSTGLFFISLIKAPVDFANFTVASMKKAKAKRDEADRVKAAKVKAEKEEADRIKAERKTL